MRSRKKKEALKKESRKLYRYMQDSDYDYDYIMASQRYHSIKRQLMKKRTPGKGERITALSASFHFFATSEELTILKDLTLDALIDTATQYAHKHTHIKFHIHISDCSKTYLHNPHNSYFPDDIKVNTPDVQSISLQLSFEYQNYMPLKNKDLRIFKMLYIQLCSLHGITSHLTLNYHAGGAPSFGYRLANQDWTSEDLSTLVSRSRAFIQPLPSHVLSRLPIQDITANVIAYIENRMDVNPNLFKLEKVTYLSVDKQDLSRNLFLVRFKIGTKVYADYMKAHELFPAQLQDPLIEWNKMDRCILQSLALYALDLFPPIYP